MKSISAWLALAGTIALLICLSPSYALTQTQAQNQAEELTDANAALAQAQADTKKQTDCRSFSGPARSACNSAAAAQVSAHNKRVADAQKLVLKLEAESRKPSSDAALEPKASTPHAAPAEQPTSPTTRQTGGSAATGATLTQSPSAQAPVEPTSSGSQRFDVVQGGLMIDVPGTGFPPGYAPAWSVTKKPEIIRSTRSVAGKVVDQKYVTIGFGSDGGHPVATFAISGGFAPCTADLAGLPQVITKTPKRFDLVNIRGPDRYCNPASYQGWLMLSSDSDGNILAGVDLTTHLGKYANEMHFVGTDAKFAPERTPQWAQKQANQKADQVALNAKLLQLDEAKLGHKLSPLEQALSLDWDADPSYSESSAVGKHPQEYAQLCLQHNPRACLVLRVVVETSMMSDTLKDSPTVWSKTASQTVMAALREVCGNQKTGEDCEGLKRMKYAMIVNYGPKEQDPTHCLSSSPEIRTTQKEYSDAYGHKSYGAVEREIVGFDIHNGCAFAIDFALNTGFGYSDTKLTLSANGRTSITSSLMAVEWIRKH